MEFILIVLFIAWLYTLMDNKVNTNRAKDKHDQDLYDIMHKESDFDRYIKELESDPDERLRREFHRTFRNNRSTSNKPKPKPKPKRKPKPNLLTPEPVAPIDTQDDSNELYVPDFYTGSNQWYADKQDYLRSNKWYAKKLKRQSMDNHQCCLCLNTHGLECHHITYEHLFNEPMDDLRTLCRSCHQETHDHYGYAYDGYFPVLNTQKDN